MGNIDLVKSITELDKYFAYAPSDATGYDLDECKFIKIIGNSKYYFYFSIERWLRTETISTKEFILPYYETEILEFLSAFKLCPTTDSKRILAKQRVLEIQLLNEI